MRLRHVRPLTSTVSPGRVLRYRRLGSDSLYRVVDADDATVALEVISAPGLEAGLGVRLSIDAVRTAEGVSVRGEFARSISAPTTV
jgi:hypothetical protein